jgi:hypothetical protein
MWRFFIAHYFKPELYIQRFYFIVAFLLTL